MKTILFQYECPVGTFWIHPEPAGRVQLRIDNHRLKTYSSPKAAALDVFQQSTGWAPWDTLEGVSAPPNLHKWKRGTGLVARPKARATAARAPRVPDDDRT